jgi:hypothetical protein
MKSCAGEGRRQVDMLYQGFFCRMDLAQHCETFLMMKASNLERI